MTADWEYSDEETDEGEIPGRGPDPAVEDAIPAIREHVETQRDSVFYLRQLQVLFEKRFYHWVTGRAVRQLVDAGQLKQELAILHPTAADPQGQVKFILHPSMRFYRRVIQRKIALIRRFSHDRVGHACGRQAEILFSRALMAKGFRLVGENVRAFDGREWTKTGHDLDFIVERDGRVYGCEVKNRFEYIDRQELQTKLAICAHLEIIPLFILRHAAKTYIDVVRRAGGFTKIFVDHIYPLGLEELVEDITREFPGLRVRCPRDLPDTILDSFLAWHARRGRPLVK